MRFNPHPFLSNFLDTLFVPKQRLVKEQANKLLESVRLGEVGASDLVALHEGSPPIHHIVSNMSPELHSNQIELVIRGLIRAGADINQRGISGATTLSCLAWTFTDPQENQWFASWCDRLRRCGYDFQSHAHVALLSAMRFDECTRRSKKKQEGSAWGVRAKALLDQGLPISSPNDVSSAASPLVFAVETGNAGQIKAMLEAGVDPCWIDPVTQDTLFAKATKGVGCQDAFMAIPSARLTPIANHLNRKGQSPLHQAVRATSLPLVRILLNECKVKPCKDASGRWPLDLVRRTDRRTAKSIKEIASLLRASEPASDNPDHQLHVSSRALALESAKDAIARGASVVQKDEHQQTCLHHVILHGAQRYSYAWTKRHRDLAATRVAITHLLASSGIEIDAADDKGETALHLAVRYQQSDMVEALLDLGANPRSRNKAGHTPMHLWQTEEEMDDFIQYLVQEECAKGSVGDQRRQIVRQFLSRPDVLELMELKDQASQKPSFAWYQDDPMVKTRVESVRLHQVLGECGNESEVVRKRL